MLLDFQRQPRAQRAKAASEESPVAEDNGKAPDVSSSDPVDEVTIFLLAKKVYTLLTSIFQAMSVDDDSSPALETATDPGVTVRETTPEARKRRSTIDSHKVCGHFPSPLWLG